MKNTLKKLNAFVCTLVVLIPALILPAAAEGEFVFKNYNPNEIARTIVNSLMAIVTVAGLVYGGWHLAVGIWEKDGNEKKTGIIAMLGSLVIGGLVITVVNLII